MGSFVRDISQYLTGPFDICSPFSAINIIRRCTSTYMLKTVEIIHFIFLPIVRQQETIYPSRIPPQM